MTKTGWNLSATVVLAIALTLIGFLSITEAIALTVIIAMMFGKE